MIDPGGGFLKMHAAAMNAEEAGFDTDDTDLLLQGKTEHIRVAGDCLADIVLMEPALNENYFRIKGSIYSWG